MEQMFMEFERKKLLIQDDAEGLLVLANKMQSFLENKEENFEKLKNKLKKYPEIQSEMVQFNVGGTQFATYKSTLIKKIRKTPLVKEADNEDQQKLQYYEPHLLECMMNGVVKIEKDSNGAIFIDRNPKYFKYILDYLRYDHDAKKDFDTSYFKSRLIDKLIEEVEYFNLSGLKELLLGDIVKAIYSKSYILKHNNLQITFNDLVRDKAVLKNKEWTLLYRATEDGFAAADFHRKCDNKGATLMIIKSRDYPNVFGGFTATSWDSTTQEYKSDHTAFIFSLVNSMNMPLIFNNCQSANAICCKSDYGPAFGRGHDMYICSNANTQSDSHSYLTTSYYADGFEFNKTKAKNFLAGSHTFYVSEIEVFQISSSEA